VQAPVPTVTVKLTDFAPAEAMTLEGTVKFAFPLDESKVIATRSGSVNAIVPVIFWPEKAMRTARRSLTPGP
jgi:hypothetical protein